MENMNPTLNLLLHLRFGLERGLSVRNSVLWFCQNNPGKFAELLKHWVAQRDSGIAPQNVLHQKQSIQLQSLLRVMDRGLLGESIHPTLVILQEEIVEAVKEEMELFTLKLPFKMLIPLLLLQFPAFLILLFGPIVQDLLQNL